MLQGEAVVCVTAESAGMGLVGSLPCAACGSKQEFVVTLLLCELL